MKRNIIVIILITIILICFNLKIKNKFNQNDLIFFKFYSEDNSLSKSIKIKISKNQTNSKNINLLEVNNKIEEKIAPGMSGDFEIQLMTYEDINYKLFFKSENEKPNNLYFYLEKDLKKYNTLEKIGENINGKLEKLRIKIIKIYWKWEYEIGNNENKQDTEDGEKLQKYNFNIYVVGS